VRVRVRVRCAQWVEFTNIIQKIAVSQGNSSVPILYYVDHVHGANYVYGATIFPHVRVVLSP
jgi:beta-glucosidase